MIQFTHMITMTGFKTDDGKGLTFDPVERAIKEVMDSSEDFSGTQLGVKKYRDACVRLLLGDDNTAVKENRVIGIQSVAGTGALRVVAEFLSSVLKKRTVYLSEPTYINHDWIFKRAGFKKIKYYRYWDHLNSKLDINGMIEDLTAADDSSVILMQPVAHNPTGADPPWDDWVRIADVMSEKNHFPFFDMAYHGFASGDLELDARVVRYFAEKGFEMFVSQTFTKIMSLWDFRIGNLVVVVSDPKVNAAVESQMSWIIRGMYSTPPKTGAKIVYRVLTNDTMREEWMEGVKLATERINRTRQSFSQRLSTVASFRDWSFVSTGIGCFSYSGFSMNQILWLRNNKHVYLPETGRINICNINSGNMMYTAESFRDVLTFVPHQSKHEDQMNGSIRLDIHSNLMMIPLIFCSIFAVHLFNF